MLGESAVPEATEPAPAPAPEPVKHFLAVTMAEAPVPAFSPPVDDMQLVHTGRYDRVERYEREQREKGDEPLVPQDEEKVKSGRELTLEDVHVDESKLIDYEHMICRLCQRQFKTATVLEKHGKISDLHKENLDKRKRDLLRVLRKDSAIPLNADEQAELFEREVPSNENSFLASINK